MKAVVISFTANGCGFSEKIASVLEELGWEVRTYIKSKYAPKGKAEQVKEPLLQWMKSHWETSGAVIFVGAAGIAVRTIAPYVTSKKTDPAVLSMDEKGQFCIPLLSGHLGGANALAADICAKTGSLAVITTATDLNDCFAVDLFAKEQGQEIQDMKQAKEISAALLAGKRIVTVGLGCRKGTPSGEIKTAIEEVCARRKIPLSCICRLASIDLKKEEAGILETAALYGVPFQTYSAEELKAAEGAYTPSLFVESVTGVDNVCERSAVLGSRNGVLIQKKQAVGRVTVALAIEGEWDEA